MRTTPGTSNKIKSAISHIEELLFSQKQSVVKEKKKHMFDFTSIPIDQIDVNNTYHCLNISEL